MSGDLPKPIPDQLRSELSAQMLSSETNTPLQPEQIRRLGIILRKCDSYIEATNREQDRRRDDQGEVENSLRIMAQRDGISSEEQYRHVTGWGATVLKSEDGRQISPLTDVVGILSNTVGDLAYWRATRPEYENMSYLLFTPDGEGRNIGAQEITIGIRREADGISFEIHGAEEQESFAALTQIFNNDGYIQQRLSPGQKVGYYVRYFGVNNRDLGDVPEYQEKEFHLSERSYTDKTHNEQATKALAPSSSQTSPPTSETGTPQG